MVCPPPSQPADARSARQVAASSWPLAVTRCTYTQPCAELARIFSLRRTHSPSPSNARSVAALPRPLAVTRCICTQPGAEPARIVPLRRTRSLAPSSTCQSRFRRLAPLHMLAVAAWCLSVAVRRARSCLRLAAHARPRRVASSRCDTPGMRRPASPHKLVAPAWMQTCYIWAS